MLVFLDIDGVMVPAKSWESPQVLSDGFYKFSDRAVRVLQSLISDHTIIMLTTSHKSRFTITEWKNIFNLRDIKVNNFRKLDDNVTSKNRKEEILSWVNVNGVPNDFIILDDDKTLNSLPDFLKDRLILTNSTVGLTEAHYDEILSKLNKQPQFT
ncbi:MAG: hypothetical protein L6Q78_06870 [Bacteroidia bacterium]|nr:hypothetical protein [Bacteroidia bacterium]